MWGKTSLIREVLGEAEGMQSTNLNILLFARQMLDASPDEALTEEALAHLVQVRGKLFEIA